MDDFAEYFEEIGEVLTIVSPDDLEAGFDRAATAEGYLDSPDAAILAAILFDGVATRHPLLDGNKRLAWQSMTTFLDMNGIWFDPPEYAAYEAAIATVTGKKTVEDLARFIRDHTSPWDG